MAKVYGMNGLVTGRRGNDVFVIRNGVQVVRQYNPKPFQPKSAVQTSVRARFKLMSQLSEVLAQVIAIPRSGTVSSRNAFVSRNFSATAYENETASVDLESIQLTSSVIALPSVIVTREGTTASIHLAYRTGVALGFSSVVYVVLSKEPDNKLRVINSQVVSEGGDLGYPLDVELISADRAVVVYAYGIVLKSELARVRYGEMEAPTAENVAKLITSRMLQESDYQVTETRAKTSNPTS